jgi:site-specific recombinase XerD
MQVTDTEPEPTVTDALGTIDAVPARSVGVRRHELAPKTLLLYAGDWARFAAFCAAVGARARPAATETVVAFLQAPDVGRAAMRRWLAAIDHRHLQYSLPCPGDNPQVRRALKLARKSAARRPRLKPPSTASLHNMSGRCRHDLAGLRDRAVLLLLAAGLSRSQMVGLQAETLRWAEDGVRVEGQAFWIPRGARHDLCPVRALEDWLRASSTR